MLKRFLSFWIDWMIIWIIGFVLSLLGPAFDPQYLLQPSIRMFSAYGVILSVLWYILAPLFRDFLFGNASLGKKLFGLRVTDKNGSKAKPLALILRNLAFWLVPVEMILVLCNHGTRLGDMLAGTQVVSKK